MILMDVGTKADMVPLVLDASHLNLWPEEDCTGCAVFE